MAHGEWLALASIAALAGAAALRRGARDQTETLRFEVDVTAELDGTGAIDRDGVEIEVPWDGMTVPSTEDIIQALKWGDGLSYGWSDIEVDIKDVQVTNVTPLFNVGIGGRIHPRPRRD